tara:strand:- start:384 stop:695 length:312 start_codon:yes stop_codon:yes gene_type:complete
MMKYYVSQTTVEATPEGRIPFSMYESVITKPDTLAAAKNSLRRYRALGIPHLHLCEHPEGSRRWGMLNRESNKRLKTRKMTVADVAKDLAELEAESKEKENNS